MPASRSARAMIFAPRSCPSRPGLATTTRIFLSEVVAISTARVYCPNRAADARCCPPLCGPLMDDDRHLHVGMQRAVQPVGAPAQEGMAVGASVLIARVELGWTALDADVVE